ncbi:MAG: hypothetical protein ABL921_27050 [Pirellula sp.]
MAVQRYFRFGMIWAAMLGWLAFPAPEGRSQENSEQTPFKLFGRREVVSESQLRKAGQFRLPTLTAHDEQILIEHCLMLTDLKVVNDARCHGLGPWSFAGLMTEVTNAPVTGLDPKQFVYDWINAVEGSFTVSALETWDKLSGGSGKLNEIKFDGLKLDKVPFRLLAIVNRLDLRKNLVLGGTGAGEIRFVYFLHDANGVPLNTTVIFEFAVRRTTFNEIRAWGREWYQLRLIDLEKPEFNIALQQITDQYTLRGADVEMPPNQSALSQIRVSIEEGKNWRFAEFKVDVQNSGKLVPVTTKQTPLLDLNKSKTINKFLADYEAAILGNRHQAPVRFDGEDFLARNANLSSGRPPQFFWTGDRLPDKLLEARHRFSLNTCSGCHARETDTDFFHVGPPKKKGDIAMLSKFLTGIEVADPAGQRADDDPSKTKRRKFHDLKDRAEDLQRLVEIGLSYESARAPLNSVH